MNWIYLLSDKKI